MSHEHGSVKRRGFLVAGSALLTATLLPLGAAAQLEERSRRLPQTNRTTPEWALADEGRAQPWLHRDGVLRIAVYADFPPYSMDGDGVEIAVGKALAERLDLTPEIVEFVADEDMGDDLRNMVWRGHWRGTENMGHEPADVMLHVPIHPYFVSQQRRVAIFGPYHRETMAMARDPARVPPPSQSAADTLDVFTREKIGVEIDTHGSDFLMQALNGSIRGNVVHFRRLAAAVDAMVRGDIAAVMATRTQLEWLLGEIDGFVVDPLRLPELRILQWPVGMAVRSRLPELTTALATALDELQQSGQLARIYASYGLTHQTP